MTDTTERLTPKDSPESAEEAFERFIAEMAANPPPAPDPAELDRSRRHARFAEASAIRGRLPRWIVEMSRAHLLSRIHDERLQRVAQGWGWGHGNVMLLGSTGKGKTAAAGFLFRRLLADAVAAGGDAWVDAQTLAWVRVEQLERDMRAHPLGKGELADLRIAKRAKLLFLDEVGWETDRTIVASILAERYDASLPSVITSGRTSEELGTLYGGAVVRRMSEHKARRCFFIECFDAQQGEPEKRVIKPLPIAQQEETARRLGEKL